MRLKLKILLTLPGLISTEGSMENLLKKFKKPPLHENSTLYDILKYCSKKKKNRALLQIAFLHALLKAVFLIGALWMERAMIAHLRDPGIVILKQIEKVDTNTYFTFPLIFSDLANLKDVRFFGQMFISCFSYANETLLSANYKNFPKIKSYTIAIASLLGFWFIGAFGVRIAERIFDAIFGDSMISYFADSASNDLIDQSFPRALRKTTRASRDADVMQMVRAFNTFGPNVGNVIKNDLSPLLVNAILLIARQIFIASYEQGVSVLFASLIVGALLYRNKDALFADIMNDSKQYYESIKELSANSTDVLENINVVKVSAMEKNEKKFRIQLFQDMITSKKKLDKTVKTVDNKLFRYGLAYGGIHLLFGPGSSILTRFLEMLELIQQSEESTKPIDRDTFVHLFKLIELGNILFADLSFVTNVMRTIFQKSADVIIHSNEIREQVKIIFNDDEIPIEKKEIRNPLSVGPGEIVFNIDEAFGYKSYIEEKTQIVAKTAEKIAQEKIAKAKAKMRKERGLD